MFVLAQAIMLVLAAAVERAWPQALRIGGVPPDLVLVLIACIGVTRGAVAGYAAGLLGGFLVAASGEGPFGTILLSHMAVGFLAGQAGGRVFVDHLLAAPALALVATLLAGIIHLVISPPAQFSPWLATLGLGALYNVVVSPLSYTFARAVNLRWPRHAEA